MLGILKPIILLFVKSSAFKRFVIDILEVLAKQTNNELDDQAVAFIKSKLLT
jgi:hypothetical protein